MNSPDPSEEKLAAFLRAAEHDPLPDDGFTTRVTAALPPPRRAFRFFRSDGVIGVVVVALLFLLVLGGGTADLHTFIGQSAGAVVNLLHSLLEEPAALTVIALTIAALLISESDESSWPAQPEN